MTLTKFPSIGKALYGFLFVAVLPAWLITWARMTEASVRLPMAGSFEIGTVLASCGAVIMVCGMAGLIVYGKGMPMNPYPPSIM